MLKKLANFFFSTKLTAVLFIVFAVAMATGTILDRNMDTSPTPYTRQLIYNAWWFEAIMGIFIINFVGNIFRFRLLRKEKWATLILHLAFIFILLGAFITRYVGFEGMMPIREGATENQMYSRKTYISGRIVGDYKVNDVLQQRNIESEVDFSPRLSNNFNQIYTYGDKKVTIKLKEFIAGAEKDIIPTDNGKRYLKIVESSNGKPSNHFLEDGQVSSLNNILISLNKYQDGAINITETDKGLFIESPFESEYMTMATGTTGQLIKDSIQPLKLRSRYVVGNMQLVFPKPVVKGDFGIVKRPKILKNNEDGVVLEVSANGETKDVGLIGGQFIFNNVETFEVGGLEVSLRYGTKLLNLPFAVKLNDFIAEKYPGTEQAYSSFESKVTVFDEQEGDFDYHIYMNHILDHRGYRFFQSNFDPDERGTILSVNHDFWGTNITYGGYLLLYFGLMAILLAKHTRFDSLRNQLKKIKKKKASLAVMLLGFSLMSFGQAPNPHNQSNPQQHELTKADIDSILRANITPKAHADEFAKLVIQDYSGRMMPMHTYASEVLRKLSKLDTYEDFDASQVVLSMQESPLLWYNVPIIYLPPMKSDSLRSVIGVSKEGKRFALKDFFDKNGAYKLEPYRAEAYRVAAPNGYQTMVKEADQRVNLLYNVLQGWSMKIFPVPNDENNTWISSAEYRMGGYQEQIKDSLYQNFINNGFTAYLVTLNSAKQMGSFGTAEDLLNGFKKTQQQYGADVMLTDEKVETEILYNKLDVFKKLFSYYMYVSTVLFVFLIAQIFSDKNKWLRYVINTLIGVIILLFTTHTGGLIVRWYLSGHAPWSDAYESMIYVAWSVMLFGLLFGRRSNLTIASSAFVASIILMVAHWNWMDPAIANLEPVLQGYWLMIHVSVIVASYGPFALGWVLGVVALLLMLLTNKKNKERMLINLKEITIINEMALTVGLVMLTIGNFLGGMWANESWGRYWGWDPKETWALISIMIYAFVIHLRLIPDLRGRWLFNFMSILTFGSILMTYFGVNFYLSGLHSYASGEQILSFQFIAIYVSIILILGALSYFQYKKYYKS